MNRFQTFLAIFIWLFADIPWSTPHVHRLTMQRAAEVNVPVVNVPGWYDVDDASSLALLLSELAGRLPVFASRGLHGAPAPATRAHFAGRDLRAGAQAS